MKVVFGYDGSDSARDVIPGLHRAGLPQETEVLVVSVADAWPPLPQSAYKPATGESETPIIRKAHALAAECLAEAQLLAAEGARLVTAEFPRWKVSHAAYAGSPYLALIEPLDSTADLVVIGAQGKSALQRFMLGSVSQFVLTHAACSVRISRRIKNAGPSHGPIRIVLGVDGSVPSALAVSAVAGRAWPPDTEVKIIASLDMKFSSALLVPGASGWASAWTWRGEEDSRSRAQRAVNAVAEELRSAGLVATPVIEEGDPKRVLVEEAERWGADCIFVGAKGHSGLERFLLGSVSAAVACGAYCSVEVVRQG